MQGGVDGGIDCCVWPPSGESPTVFGIMIAISMQETALALLHSRLAGRVLFLATFLGSWLRIPLRNLSEVLFGPFLEFRDFKQ